MRVLVIGAGGVGAAVACVAPRDVVAAALPDPATLGDRMPGKTWDRAGVLGPEAFPPGPFLELLADYGAPHAIEDR